MINIMSLWGYDYSRRRGAAILVFVAASVLGIFSIAAAIGGYRINTTPSEPLGLWRIVALKRPVAVGDLVFICPPDTATTRAAHERGYLRCGMCEGDNAPLIKTVIATAGQSVEIRDGVRVDGIPIANSNVAKTDGKGRPLTPYSGGRVPADTVFLHSSFVASYDSRYFGPLPTSGILGLAQGVLTYAP